MIGVFGGMRPRKCGSLLKICQCLRIPLIFLCWKLNVVINEDWNLLPSFCSFGVFSAIQFFCDREFAFLNAFWMILVGYFFSSNLFCRIELWSWKSVSLEQFLLIRQKWPKILLQLFMMHVIKVCLYFLSFRKPFLSKKIILKMLTTLSAVKHLLCPVFYHVCFVRFVFCQMLCFVTWKWSVDMCCVINVIMFLFV